MLNSIITIGSFMICFILLLSFENNLKRSIKDIESKMVMSSYRPTAYNDFLSMGKKVKFYKMLRFLTGLIITIVSIGVIKYLL